MQVVRVLEFHLADGQPLGGNGFHGYEIPFKGSSTPLRFTMFL